MSLLGDSFSNSWSSFSGSMFSSESFVSRSTETFTKLAQMAQVVQSELIEQARQSEMQTFSKSYDPVLEIKTSERCKILHHLISLSKAINPKDEELVQKNSGLVDLLLSLPVVKSSSAEPVVELDSRKDPKAAAEQKKAGMLLVCCSLMFNEQKRFLKALF